jgi:mRNA-degrading endonuclease RelE of RelBE toxin-antitoxin system
MQITIDIPDNLPAAIVQQYLSEFKTKLKQLQEREEFKINKTLCLNTLAKIKQGDYSDFSEIDDIDSHIKTLRNEIN